jgi:Na+/melibiose symporter-like transporter
VDEDWILNARPKPMSSSIAGMYAVASKPGQSLAPMLGWFVLRSAGYDPGHADNIVIDDYGVDGRAKGVSVPQAPCAATVPAAVSDALLLLLVWLPAVVAIVQILMWQLYQLHGPRLQHLKQRAKQMVAVDAVA